jgi:hypothetical protein
MTGMWTERTGFESVQPRVYTHTQCGPTEFPVYWVSQVLATVKNLGRFLLCSS